MAGGKFETTPLVVDGVLYATGADDRAFALDARSGRPIWLYQRALPPDIRPCCGRVNRGLAILGNTLFMGTIDGYLIALDARDGHLMWSTPLGSAEEGYSVTVAPLIVVVPAALIVIPLESMVMELLPTVSVIFVWPVIDTVSACSEYVFVVCSV